MDINAFAHKSYPVVSTRKCELPLRQPNEVFAAPSLSMSDEIIDYVEIQANNYRPVISRQTPYPICTDRCTIGKGTLIDIWI
jgi:hypothetical protein